MSQAWIAERMSRIDSSGIRKVFDLAAKMKDPVNLSIGQPDFDVPDEIREAAIAAISTRKNGYSVTQGIPSLRELLQARVLAELGHADRTLFVTSGTSGALVLALTALVNPGDEVIIFDPFFVMYPHLIRLAGGTPVLIDTYPDFRIDLERVRAAITSKTKAILFNSPANPTGVVASQAEMQGLAELAAERNVALISDEIYRGFCYDAPFVTPAKFNPQTIVIDGFSKSHAMTGWRVGFMHGPKVLMDQMIKLQQYTFVCSPHPFQYAAAKALDVDMSSFQAAYHRKRDLLVEGLAADYELSTPGGAFYAFPKLPWGTGDEFVARAIEHNLLIIPGHIFSQRDTHFRISYAASDETIARGVEILRKLARLKK